jgi:hypothetical protein
MSEVEKPPEPERSGEVPPKRSAVKSVLLVLAVILALVAMSFLSLGVGYFNALLRGH